MPIKWRSVGRNAKSVGFKMGMPMPKKFPFMNAGNTFGKKRGPPLYTKLTGTISNKYIKERGKLMMPRSHIIPVREWLLYRGDLVELTGSHLLTETNKSYVLPEDRQGTILDMDYNRNLVKVSGLRQFIKKIPKSLLEPRGSDKVMHRPLLSLRLDTLS